MKIKAIFHWIFYGRGFWNYIVFILLAFIIIKFMFYPAIGFVMGTDEPVVSVVSGSMEHGGRNLNIFWEYNGEWYEEKNITLEQFKTFDFKDGINTGDLVIVTKAEMDNIDVGDVVLFEAGKSASIIHRIVEDTGTYVSMKGDANHIQGQAERYIDEEYLVGKAQFRVPYLGYVAIYAQKFLCIVPFFTCF